MKLSQFERIQYSRRNNILRENGISYKEFLKSNEWKKAKTRLYERDGKECERGDSFSKVWWGALKTDRKPVENKYLTNKYKKSYNVQDN